MSWALAMRSLAAMLFAVIVVSMGCARKCPEHPVPATPPAQLTLSTMPPRRSCDVEQIVVLTVRNTSSGDLWLRTSPDPEDDSYRHMWLELATRDGGPVPDHCIWMHYKEPFRRLRPNEATSTAMTFSCNRQEKGDWYTVTAHYEDLPIPATLPTGPIEREDKAFVEYLFGAPPPKGASRVRTRLDSNVQWIYLQSMHDEDCGAD